MPVIDSILCAGKSLAYLEELVKTLENQAERRAKPVQFSAQESEALKVEPEIENVGPNKNKPE